jgi:hypothetical protein
MVAQASEIKQLEKELGFLGASSPSSDHREARRCGPRDRFRTRPSKNAERVILWPSVSTFSGASGPPTRTLLHAETTSDCTALRRPALRLASDRGQEVPRSSYGIEGRWMEVIRQRGSHEVWARSGEDARTS